MLAYLAAIRDYPFHIEHEGTLNERAYSICARLRKETRGVLSNNYPLFCRLFIAYFTAAYQVTVQLCQEDGEEMIGALYELVRTTSPEVSVTLLKRIIGRMVRQSSIA